MWLVWKCLYGSDQMYLWQKGMYLWEKYNNMRMMYQHLQAS